MRPLILLFILIITSAPAQADIIKTFQSACFQHLDQPSKIVEQGTQLGFNMNNFGGEAWIGLNNKIDQSFRRD